MTNWKTYTIIRISTSMENHWRGSFGLDGCVNYSDYTRNYVWCINTHPYNTFKIGDKIEIDNDKTKYYNCGHDFADLEVVRRASSSAVVSRNNNSMVIPSISQNQVNTIIGQINTAINTDERNEYEAKIHVDPNSGKYNGFSIIGRRK